jgi:CelD/BcsL family acetyltransferase involved in cellulose biosynthesis
MTVHALDPLRDSRWSDLVERHPHASAFHTRAWLQALQRTYGYQPIAFTTSAPGTGLVDGIVVCKVRSWLTGRRLVSLPFADHCEPLVTNPDALDAIARHLDALRRSGEWEYIELRPVTDRLEAVPGMNGADRFWFHQLDLRRSEAALFTGLHKNAIQQQLHRADREGLTHDEGTGGDLLHTFYQLLLLTRRRHQLPPQPVAWFRNLGAAFGPAMKIRVARHEGRAVAAILTLRHGDTMIYKYAASDAKFHALGGMQLLLWKTIQEACSLRCTTLDLGRSDLDNEGLATFKDRWGATRSHIAYRRFAPAVSSASPLRRYARDTAKHLLEHVPQVCQVAAGRFLYRHAG